MLSNRKDFLTALIEFGNFIELFTVLNKPYVETNIFLRNSMSLALLHLR